MLFADAQLDTVPYSADRWALLRTLTCEFMVAFPDLCFEIVAGSSTINAQAILLDDLRYVRVYGGLAFHPLVNLDGIAFTLLHEAGHHLSSGPRLPWNPWLACECVADRWAVNEGSTALQEAAGRTIDFRKALHELDFISELGRNTGPSTRCSSSLGCWALNWDKRKRSILSDVHSVEPTCSLSNLVLSVDVAEH